MNSEVFDDACRAITCLHVTENRVSVAFISDSCLLWFASYGINRSYGNNPADWDCLGTVFDSLFEKSTRVAIDKRPHSFLVNLYTKHRKESRKFFFLNPNLLSFKFAGEKVYTEVAKEWLGSHSPEPIYGKFEKHPFRDHIAHTIIIYLAIMDPRPHQKADDYPSVVDFLLNECKSTPEQ